MEKAITLFDYAIDAITQGAKFKIDIEQKTLKINDKIILNGKESLFPVEIQKLSEDELIPELENLYFKYRHSIPSENDDKKKHKYFIALPENELTDDDMLYGEHRNVAQLKLELTILLQSQFGQLNWTHKAFKECHWFWQSERYPSFVILRKWIEK